MRDWKKSQVDIFISLAVISAVILIDRLTKIFFSQFLSPGETCPVIKNIFHFTLVHNTGIAFGLFKDHGIVFVIIGICAVVLLVFNIYYYHKMEELNRTYVVAFSLIFGGAIGNLIDRIFIGHVIDFIDFRIWPVFNVADSAITIGALMILFYCLLRPQSLSSSFNNSF